MTDIVTIANTQDMLGECPVWCDRAQGLYWVDTRGRAIRHWDYADKEITSWSVPELIGSFALRETGGLLVALETRLALFDQRTARLKTFATLESPDAGFRLNDGKCDRRGNFWVGSKYDAAPEPRGSLFRIDPSGEFFRAAEGIMMPNSLAWAPDNRTMYFADSALRTIFAYSCDVESGAISDRRVFAKCNWMPDGATVDCEGFLWSAGYDGWRIVRYSPSGHVDLEIELPVQRPTSCAFGGPGLDILYVTTARQRLSDDELARQPLAGALLAIDVGVRGLPESRFRG